MIRTMQVILGRS